MHINSVRRIAKERGIRTARLSKLNMVREIQRQEGNFDCFATAYEGNCNQPVCLWREDCFSLAMKEKTSH